MRMSETDSAARPRALLSVFNKNGIVDFAKGLDDLGLKFLVDKEYRLPSLNAMVIPDGVDDLSIRLSLLNDYNIEIGGGLGPFAGKVWRIGLMGYSAHKKHVDRLLSAFQELL